VKAISKPFGGEFLGDGPADTFGSAGDQGYRAISGIGIL